MKKFISKTGIILTLIFSFLLSLFTSATTSMKVDAAETIQETVNLVSTKREGNTITFTTKLVYDIHSITYQLVYYVNETDKHADLITDAEVKKINDYSYSFEVSDGIVGVKIWKIKYIVSDNYFKNKMTTGNNFVGDTEALYKKNYVEVTTDKLEKISGCDYYSFTPTTCETYFIFYFNLNTEIDWIVDLNLEYSIKTEHKSWYGLKTETKVNSYETKLDYTQQVTDNEKVMQYFDEWVKSTTDNSYQAWMNAYEYALNTFKRPVVGANENGNGYSWYIQPLLDIKLEDKEYFAWSGYEKQDLQEVAIVKMSYYSQGEYYEDIPVLDEDTGWIKHDPGIYELSWLEKLVNWLKNNVRIVSIVIGFIILIIGLKIINIPLSLVGLGIDKTSRLERKLDKQYKRQLKAAKQERALNKLESKQAKKNIKKEKKIRRNGYNRNNSNYHFH